MTRTGKAPDWTLVTIGIALLAGIAGLLFAVLLAHLGAWPVAQCADCRPGPSRVAW